MARNTKIWDAYNTWEEAEEAWDQGAEKAAKSYPIKGLNHLPNIPGITAETKKNLKWKSLRWMLTKDDKGEVRRGFLKHPLKYGLAFIKSLLKKKPYTRKDDYFLYGINSVQEFKEVFESPDSLFVLGFSYCQKPFECPSGRFTDKCIHDPGHPCCRQCFIGKAMNALPEKNAIPLAIPTVHYIGGKIFDIAHHNPGKQVVFVITACEMTLEMFGDWGNMVGIKGIGVRLDGRICNTMKAFELSEKGVKPGLTTLHEDVKKTILDLICHLRKA